MKVNLTYFKDSGKFYSEGSYTTRKKEMFDVWTEVKAKQHLRRLPGLVDGASFPFILVDVPEHKNNHPYLVVDMYIYGE